jgi:hypothetical protein
MSWVNHTRKSTTLKWKGINSVAKMLVENDLGMNAFKICDEAGPFPSVSYVLEEHSGRE